MSERWIRITYLKTWVSKGIRDFQEYSHFLSKEYTVGENLICIFRIGICAFWKYEVSCTGAHSMKYALAQMLYIRHALARVEEKFSYAIINILTPAASSIPANSHMSHQ